jgi:choline-glycine betaine transporter
LYPIFGDRIYGWLGHSTDAFCTVGTLLGVATSLGLGAMKINAGLTRLADIASGRFNFCGIAAECIIAAGLRWLG